jgi:hypothetical protein
LPKILFPLVFELVNAGGKPLPPTPFRVTLPDGSVKDGLSDSKGFIRFPDNAHPGQAKLILFDPKKGPPPPPASQASPTPPTASSPPGHHPIEIRLVDGEGKALPDTGFKITLPDGAVKEGKSDGDGFIRIPENLQSGDLTLALTAPEGEG